eukprot:CAMPEP_0177733746 /NCGR_PEP_ID=MMETSP0484_2-20121128/23853_1 /TAXON_ID=354590 /ORGANISM="Rhodomonas lens, Strain RHODO" /LENGTH=43 /DNA_ID= /DNA_START= /DNA_END= /DNA_ORIENTATION=
MATLPITACRVCAPSRLKDRARAKHLRQLLDGFSRLNRVVCDV